MPTATTFTATIYAGLREGYTGPVHSPAEVEAIAQAYCDQVGLCVWMTTGRFIYTRGAEDGVALGLIHYPRFPQADPRENIRGHALALAWRLRRALGQERVTVVFPDETVTLP